MAKKKKEKTIFDGVRKQIAPPTKKFRTRRNELERNKKHKGKDIDARNY